MKYILPLILVLSFLKANSQSYKPLLANNVQWYQTEWFEGTDTQYYECTGDSLLNGRHYRKLWRHLSVHHTTSPRLSGLLREDTATKRVYAIDLSGSNPDTTEKLIYDFGMAIGDTVQLYTSPFTGDTSSNSFVLDSTGYDTTITHNKLYYLSVKGFNGIYPGVVWAEGSGSLSGFNRIDEYWEFQQFSARPFYFIATHTLLCVYKDSSRVLYVPFHTVNEPNYTIDTCYIFIVGGLAEKAQSSIRLVPNPGKGVLHFETGFLQLPTDPMTLTVFDMSGKKIREQIIHSEMLKNDGQLDLTDQEPGLYLFLLRSTSGDIWTNKFILQAP